MKGEAARDRGPGPFGPSRPMLLRLAYRMLGSVADAEDVVQDAFLRWTRVDPATEREPEAFLCTMVTRLCLDQLRAARHRREVYPGPWLPEPLVEDDGVEDVTLPLMLALDRLSPLERAVFLLHDVFGVGFGEIAATLDREAAACRQLATRARTHVRDARPRFSVAATRGREIAEAFFAASRSGDMAALGALLAQDVSLMADGGGRRTAASRALLGHRIVLRLFTALARRSASGGSTLVHVACINGLPGLLTREADGELQTTALGIADGRIAAIYIMRNPDKLRHLAGGPHRP